MKNYGETIKEARIKKGYSQEELAQKLFVTKQSISKYENNHAKPSQDMLSKIEVLLDIKFSDPFVIYKK